MPELPEVEFARRALKRWFKGRTLVRTERDKRARTFRDGEVALFKKLSGRLVQADRRGKYLLLGFSDGLGCVAHLGMTGKFVRRNPGEDTKWSRARFILDSGDVIHFQDPRMFGRIEPAPRAALPESPAVKKLGLDPLVDGLSVAQLQQALSGTKLPLKVALMDQGRVAGLGNIHAAEACFRARLSPKRTAPSLSPAEWRALVKGIDGTIAFALDVEGDGDEIEYVEEPGASNPFLVYGRKVCRRCKGPIHTFTQAQRTTHWCPRCQR